MPLRAIVNLCNNIAVGKTLVFMVYSMYLPTGFRKHVKGLKLGVVAKLLGMVAKLLGVVAKGGDGGGRVVAWNRWTSLFKLASVVEFVLSFWRFNGLSLGLNILPMHSYADEIFPLYNPGKGFPYYMFFALVGIKYVDSGIERDLLVYQFSALMFSSLIASFGPIRGCIVGLIWDIGEADGIESHNHNLQGARATGAAPGIKSIWNSTWRTGGRPGRSSGKTSGNSLTTGLEIANKKKEKIQVFALNAKYKNSLEEEASLSDNPMTTKGTSKKSRKIKRKIEDASSVVIQITSLVIAPTKKSSVIKKAFIVEVGALVEDDSKKKRFVPGSSIEVLSNGENMTRMNGSQDSGLY
ncbi:hypothetical protein Tco_0162411 [Tanacetum coccineum]